MSTYFSPEEPDSEREEREWDRAEYLNELERDRELEERFEREQAQRRIKESRDE